MLGKYTELFFHPIYDILNYKLFILICVSFIVRAELMLRLSAWIISKDVFESMPGSLGWRMT
jgi:hypothetical protein